MVIRLSKTGLILSALNILSILAISLVEFWLNPASDDSGGWLFIFPIVWNFPSSLALMPFVSLELPEWVLIGGLITLGTIQWYVIGWGIASVVKKLKNKHQST